MITYGADPELKPHGMIMRTDKQKGLTISCQCRASETKHSRIKGGGEYYEPMDIKIGDSIWRTYNNPDNHWIEFTGSDRVGI